MGAPRPSISVLFVCLGNICRSTMAEAVFRSLTHSKPAIRHVDSAGTSSYNIGSDPDGRTMATLQLHHITGYSHSARRVRSADFTKFDYIMAMDRENLWDLTRLRQAAVNKQGTDAGIAKVSLFGDYGGRKGEEIEDPYYGALDGFEIAYDQALRFSNGFLMEVLGVQAAEAWQMEQGKEDEESLQGASYFLRRG